MEGALKFMHAIDYPIVWLILGGALILFVGPALAALLRHLSSRPWRAAVGSASFEIGAPVAQPSHPTLETKASVLGNQDEILQKLTADILDAVGKVAGGDQAARERYLAQEAAKAILRAFCEMTYASIFGSQMRVLSDLHAAPNGRLPTANVRTIFDDAFTRNKADFERIGMNLDVWLSYLTGNVPLVESDVAFTTISAHGRMLLRYLVETNRNLNGPPNLQRY